MRTKAQEAAITAIYDKIEGIKIYYYDSDNADKRITEIHSLIEEYEFRNIDKDKILNDVYDALLESELPEIAVEFAKEHNL